MKPVYEGSAFSWEIGDGTLYLKGDGDLVFPKKEDGIWDIPWYYLDFGTVEFEGNITSIAPEAFHTSDLTEVDIPDTVKTVGALAFCGCRMLKKAKFGKEVETVGEYAFADCAVLEKAESNPNMKSVGYNAFENCSSMREFVPSPVLGDIGENAFLGCSSLERFFIPDSTENIEGNPFACCRKLERFEICGNPRYSSDENGILLADGGTAIKSVPGAMTEVVIGNTVKSIGKCAFRGGKIKEAVIPENVTVSENSVFADCEDLVSADIRFLRGIPGDMFGGCSSLSEIDLGHCIRIGPGAFRGCSSLEKIVLPDALDAIGEGAFENCTGLKEIRFNDSLSSIGMRAFRGCSSLEKIVLPGNLMDIGSEAFHGCVSLKKATLGMCIGDEEEYLPDNIEITYLDE